MNTEAVKTFYDLLGHKKQTEIRAIELSKDFKTSKVKGHYFVSSEKEFIDYVLRKEIEQIQLVDNSLASVVNKQLNKLIAILPDQKGLAKLIKELPKQINKIDQSKLKFITDAIGWKNSGTEEKE